MKNKKKLIETCSLILVNKILLLCPYPFLPTPYSILINVQSHKNLLNIFLSTCKIYIYYDNTIGQKIFYIIYCIFVAPLIPLPTKRGCT